MCCVVATPRCLPVWLWACGAALSFIAPSVPWAQTSDQIGDVIAFTDRYCSTCHNDVDKEGGLDLTTLAFTPNDVSNFNTWVKVHDRVQNGEMPPKDKNRPETKATALFLRGLADRIVSFESDQAGKYGRVQRRRLNRAEFENSLRDLFQLPLLRVGDQLPEDGEVAHFNKISKALDVSHVHVARYMSAAQAAMREAMAVELVKPPTTLKRFWARDNLSFVNQDGVPDRGRFPILNSQADLKALKREGPLTVGGSDPATREVEAMAWTHSHYGSAFNSIWNAFRVPVTGRYNLRFSGYTVWIGPGGARAVRAGAAGQGGLNPGSRGREPERLLPEEWHLANHADVTPGRRSEVVNVYTRASPSPAIKVGTLDLTPEPKVFELRNVELATDMLLFTDAVRFFRSRPGLTGNEQYTNPLSQNDGQPGVAFRWMEVEGPIYDQPTLPGYAVLFGDLKMKKVESGGVRIQVAAPPDPSNGYAKYVGATGQYLSRPRVSVNVEVETASPAQDAHRLLQSFIAKAYRRPITETDVAPFLQLFQKRYESGIGFVGSMVTAYTAVLASQEFVYLDEGSRGPLNDHALATRLSLLLTNAAPDAELRQIADRGELRQPGVLRAQTDRLLADPRSQRFVQGFLDYWIELRKIWDTTPDMNLYGDYFLDDWLVESAIEESQAFFTELLQRNLPARNVVDSDFTFLNERLAVHYGISGVQGGVIRKVALPAESVRGGMMTQASVLKLTANGSTTSPVLRGKWVMERIVGYEIPPPPAAVPAVEPDIRGATTIRQQLDKHRADESCAMCHRNIDPPGFALENFDVLGGWRDRYRAVARGQDPEIGFGKNGWPKTYFFGLPVDARGETVDGRSFEDIRAFKRLLLQDEAQIARNLVRQLVVYATGAPIRFTDRPQIEAIVQRTRRDEYGVRSILYEIIQNDLFLNK